MFLNQVLWTAKKLEDALQAYRWRGEGYKTIADVRACPPLEVETALRSFITREPVEPKIMEIQRQLFPAAAFPLVPTLPEAMKVSSPYELALLLVYNCNSDPHRWWNLFDPNIVDAHLTCFSQAKKIVRSFGK